MAEKVLKNSSVVVDGTDLSAFLMGHDLTEEAEMLENTKMSTTSAASRSYVAGLRNSNLTLEFIQDYAAAGPDAKLSTLLGAAPFNLTIKPDAGATSADNPQRSGMVVLENYNPLSGKVGELQMCSATFKPASSAGIARAIV